MATAPTTETPEQIAAKTAAVETAKAVETKAVTENADGIDKFLGHILPKKKPAAAPKPKEGEEAEVVEGEELSDEDKVKKAEEAKKVAAKKKVAKKVEAPAAPALDADKIAEAATRGAMKAMDDREAAKKALEKPATETDPYPYLDDSEKKKLPVFEQMEKSNPEKYKGLKAKFTASVKALQDYRAKWEAANPDKTWNDQDDEHNEFFTKNDIDWEDDDYTEAIADLKVAKVEERFKTEREADKKQMTAKERAAQLEPVAKGEAVESAKSLFAAVGGEYAKIRGENGAVNAEVLKKLNEDDPERTAMVLRAATHLEALTSENFRLFNAVVPFDENNPTHKQLADYAVAQEAEMLELPAQERVQDNKMFATSKEYYAMTKAEKAKHWTFEMKDLNTLLAADVAQNLKNQIAAEEARLSRIAEKRGWKKAEATGDEEPAASEKKAAATAQEAEPEEDFKPKAVTSVTDAAVAQLRGAKLTGGKNKLPSFFEL